MVQLEDVEDKIRSFFEKKDPSPKRTVNFNPREPNCNDQHKKYFCHNGVSTGKYSLITFIPKNLIEQFMRVANLYFLVVSLLQLTTGLSPTGRFGTAFPLVLVLTFQALKDLYEDVKRHLADRSVNNSETLVLKESGSLEKVLWKNVKVGEIVKVEGGKFFPADLVCLSSSENQGLLYIETSQLDGETNLKIKHSISQTMNLKSESDLIDLKGHIVLDHPNAQLHSVEGHISAQLPGSSEEKVYSISPDNMLLRGAMLRNTKYIWGVVVYTGNQTKLMKNLKRPPHKRSKVEKITDYIILTLFSMLIGITIACSITTFVWNTQFGSFHWYTFKGEIEPPLHTALKGLITFFILFNNFIPISLYVSMEFVKMLQARWLIDTDLEMYHEESDTPALSKTSSLNEELGCVEYIFSDKTGTLTQNKMEFLKFCVDGKSYGRGTTEIGRAAAKRMNMTMEEEAPEHERIDPDFGFMDKRIAFNAWKNESNSSSIREFLMMLAVCHTVIPEEDPNNSNSVIYQAASPDEGALVKAAQHLGFYFNHRTHDSLTVDVKGEGKSLFKILNVLEFNSTRKRMSIIVRTPQNKIVLMCKGADSIIEKLMSEQSKNSKVMQDTAKHLNTFGAEGLRTLLCVKREISEEEYSSWYEKYWQPAQIAIQNKQEQIDRACKQIETNLELVGATAIEDKLQDGVPGTIETLAEAGIKIWVLTGDKRETAINIGFACAMLDKKMYRVDLEQKTKGELRKKLLQSYETALKKKKEEDRDLAVVIDGATLELIIPPKPVAVEKDEKKKEKSEEQKAIEEVEDPSLEPLQKVFLRLALICKSVICCRVSPKQKADVVQLVKNHLKGTITLAIGDGANDVSMIQSAHIGIGISGQEGLQAARAADYSFAQFRYLKRLLLVHGRYCYRRISKLICYSFYKNAIVQLTLFYYIFTNAITGKSPYDNLSYSAFNVLWATAPILAFAILDKDVSPEKSIKFPKLYIVGQHDYYFNLRLFLCWFANSIFSSLVIFMTIFFMLQETIIAPNGQTMDQEIYGIVMYTSVIVVVNVKVILESYDWNIFTVGLSLGTIFLWPLYLLVYNILYMFIPPIFDLQQPNFVFRFVVSTFYEVRSTLRGVYFSVYTTAQCPMCWIVLFFIISTILLRDIGWKAFYRLFNQQLYHVVQELDAKNDKTTDSRSEDFEMRFPKHKKLRGKQRPLDPTGLRGLFAKKYKTPNYEELASTPSLSASPGDDVENQFNIPKNVASDPSSRNSGYSFSQTVGQAQMLRDAYDSNPQQQNNNNNLVVDDISNGGN